MPLLLGRLAELRQNLIEQANFSWRTEWCAHAEHFVAVPSITVARDILDVLEARGVRASELLLDFWKPLVVAWRE